MQPLERLVEADRVHKSVYTDQEIFDREMENIWEKTWVYCGHETQLKKSGDYVTLQIGRQPMIMVRGMDGRVRVLYNRCRHRANLVCPHDRGNGDTFRCQYHGWTYSNQGDLLAPTFDEAYDTALRKEDYGLTPAPRVATYRGLIFASASPTGISLDEHLGGAKEFLDLIIDRSPEGQIELTAGTQRMKYQ